jgi:outer membrane protein assembly factor BamB
LRPFSAFTFNPQKNNFIFLKKKMKHKNTLFIFSNGRVAAIDKKTGNIMWEIKIKQYLGAAGMSHHYGQISVEDDKLFVASSGMLLCISAKDGSLIWKNELKGWGYQFVSMANVNNEASVASAGSAASAAVIAATTA